MPCDSILDIPKAALSDGNAVNDPYIADSYEARCMFHQRKMGTPEFVARPRPTKCLNPDLIVKGPGKMNENRLDSDTGTLDAARGLASIRRSTVARTV